MILQDSTVTIMPTLQMRILRQRELGELPKVPPRAEAGFSWGSGNSKVGAPYHHAFLPPPGSDAWASLSLGAETSIQDTPAALQRVQAMHAGSSAPPLASRESGLKPLPPWNWRDPSRLYLLPLFISWRLLGFAAGCCFHQTHSCWVTLQLSALLCGL